MSEMGRKLLIIRRQRKLSLRQVEKLTTTIAQKYGDKSRRISASWLGRVERENHSIAHKWLESLKEVYGVTHEELTDDLIPESKATRSLHHQLPDIPAAVLKGLAGLGASLLPPESWLAYFPTTTLLPPLAQTEGSSPARKRPRNTEYLYGILGASDNTLIPFVQPGAIVEIDSSIHKIDSGRVFRSIFERPIYFLRSHDGYHCGWCELDLKQEWLTLVPSAMSMVSYQRWRYRGEIEIVGMVNRVLTRLGFPRKTRLDYTSPDEHSNST
ncbi:transcriptional regulator with XRE-family HTH domain [Silvibacterium bohemicum]|uniref:Transcriptional regulator with XRE-family HTH domain n=1 Tax=Silvibacterium bohemicum TaxID=1577686 RepID=A0A841JNZ1_9BACT|nr:helix-turn-helix transcriptional regulator [Silvibacterium bohemicum]MBB6142993.1 transcriptional regulator with XRE-family HTH domain [Silvibacterium bohemicum]